MKNLNSIILNSVAIFTIIQVCQSFPHKELSKNDLEATFDVSLPLHELEKKENNDLELNQDDLRNDGLATRKAIEKYDRILEKIFKESETDEAFGHYMKHIESAPDDKILPALLTWYKRPSVGFLSDSVSSEDYSANENQGNAGFNSLENSSIDKSVNHEEGYEYEYITPSPYLVDNTDYFTNESEDNVQPWLENSFVSKSISLEENEDNVSTPMPVQQFTGYFNYPYPLPRLG